MTKRFVWTRYGRVRRSAVPPRRWVAFALAGQIGFVTYPAFLFGCPPGTDTEAAFDRHAETIVARFRERLAAGAARDEAGRLVLGELDLLELADRYDPD